MDPRPTTHDPRPTRLIPRVGWRAEFGCKLLGSWCSRPFPATGPIATDRGPAIQASDWSHSGNQRNQSYDGVDLWEPGIPRRDLSSC